MKEKREPYHQRRQAHVEKIIDDLQLTYAAFAKRVGVNPNTVSRWFMPTTKGGHQNIGDDNARKIEVALGMQPGDLDRPETPIVNPSALGPWPFKFVSEARYNLLGPEQRLILQGEVRRIISELLTEESTKPEERPGKSKRSD